MERLGEVYRIESSKGAYIGSALGSSLGRWGNHIAKCAANAHHNIRLQEAFSETGVTGFTFSILETQILESDLRKREKYWSELISSINAKPLFEVKMEIRVKIIQAIIAGVTYRKIAKEFGISHGSVGNIKKQYFQHGQAF